MNSSEITALIADDEAHMRTFLKLILMDLGIQKVYLMQNGMDAVEAFKEYHPNLVLLDINMNKMNGVEALEQIKEINPNASVVMMTAVATRDSVEDCKKKGAIYYILKTQKPEIIKQHIGEVIESITAVA